VATFALQRKLPYKRMLVVTGVMIGFVLVVMVGQTARTMQGTGWIPITPIDVDPPYWLGLWFGVYPTWETIGAQVAAMAFVIGSYALAQEVRVRRPRRRAARTELRGRPGQGAAWRSDAGVAVDANGHQHPNGGDQREGAEDGAGAREATQSPTR
jgi:high-affinity iron transporter